MTDGLSIEVEHLTKEYRGVTAVDDLSFTVAPGRVTGYLGPNGAGKTTTMRILLDLVRPTSGRATIGGRRYTEMESPLNVVGAVLEASSAHRQMTGRNHLRAVCLSAGFPLSRADEVLEAVGLMPAADRRFRGYSLGMQQRLGIATALLGDPGVLILDEPANGLDPEGIRWMRELLRGLAAEGRTVLVSSHLLSEMQSLADDVVIVATGKLVRQGSVTDVIDSMASDARVVVRSQHAGRLRAALEALGVHAAPTGDDVLMVTGATEQLVGETAHAAGIPVYRLATEQADLEDVFLELTRGSASIR